MKADNNTCIWSLISNTHIRKAESLEIIIQALFLNNEEINFEFKNKWLKIYKSKNWKPVGDLSEHLKLADQFGITKTNILNPGKQKVNILARYVNNKKIKITEYISITLFNLVTFIGFNFRHIFKSTLELLKKNNNSFASVDQIFSNLDLDSSFCNEFDKKMMRYNLKQKDHIFYILMSSIFFDVNSTRDKNQQFSSNYFQIKLFDYWFFEIDNLIAKCNTEFENIDYQKVLKIRSDSESWSNYITRNFQSNYDYIISILNKKSKKFSENFLNNNKEEGFENSKKNIGNSNFIENANLNLNRNTKSSYCLEKVQFSNDFFGKNQKKRKPELLTCSVNCCNFFSEGKSNCCSLFSTKKKKTKNYYQQDEKFFFLPKFSESKSYLNEEFLKNPVTKIGDFWDFCYNNFSQKLNNLFNRNFKNWISQINFEQNFFNSIEKQKIILNLTENSNISIKNGQNLLLISESSRQIQLKIKEEICKTEINTGNYEYISFYEGSSDEDFIGFNDFSIEASSTNNNFVPGVFSKILAKSFWNPNQAFCLIIENIDNSNAISALKPLMPIFFRQDDAKSLIGISHPKLSSYIFSNPDQKIYLPSNLSIIGTIFTNLEIQNPNLPINFYENWNIFYLNSENFDNKLEGQFILDTSLTWFNFFRTINFFAKKENITKNLLSSFYIDEKVIKNPQLFAEKVLFFLWVFTFRENRSKFFRFNSLAELITNFVKNKGDDRFSIFLFNFFKNNSLNSRGN